MKKQEDIAMKITHGTIQAEIYCRLKKLGVKSQLEYKYGNSRFDVAVFDNSDKILCVIEVKRSSRCKKQTKQRKKYEQFGFPVFYCCGYSEIYKTVGLVYKLTNNTHVTRS